MREYHVRICERLGVKFPGPTRHLQPSCSIAFDVSLPSDTFRAPGRSVTEALGHEQTHALHKIRAYSITSSATASSVGGTSMPSRFAVCRLMTNSNLVG